jgi:integrase
LLCRCRSSCGRKARGEKVIVNDRTTFAQLAEAWRSEKKKRLRPKKQGGYRRALDNALLPRFGEWLITALDVDAVAAFIADLESEGLHSINPKRPRRPLGRSSIDNYCKPLHGVLSLAVRRGLVRSNPFDALLKDDRPAAPVREIHEWTGDELGRLFAALEEIARRPDSRQNYTPLLRLTAHLGLRQSEVLGLKWADSDNAAGTLHIERQWTRLGEYGPTKTKAGVRSIALPDDVRKQLRDLRVASRYSQDDHPIFASREGTPLGHRNLTSRGFEPAAAAAGLDVTFHDLRHAAASRLIDGGLDPVTAAAILGHGNANITLGIYAHRFNAGAKAEEVR